MKKLKDHLSTRDKNYRRNLAIKCFPGISENSALIMLSRTINGHRNYNSKFITNVCEYCQLDANSLFGVVVTIQNQ